MHQEDFVLAELGRLYIDSRALVIQLQAAQKRISELEQSVAKDAGVTPDSPSV